ncbi:MAG: DUF6186 family protein [Actinomycetota bacterium]|jgi:hypothetical protein|nr:DUF6186 family protein [Actinomycetota bacterium]
MRTVTVAIWAVLAAAALLLEAFGRRRITGLVSAEELIRYFMKARVGRVIFVLGWMWLGWHLFAR